MTPRQRRESRAKNRATRDRQAVFRAHAGHGLGTADDGPVDPDCPCRATPREAECATAGQCGFCRLPAPTNAAAPTQEPSDE